MRTIKFRAWHKASYENDMLNDFDVWRGQAHYGEKDDYILMQFTGLFDKKGREIYEGDILLNNQVVEWINPENAQYEQDSSCWGIQNGKYTLASYREDEDFLVVGNIYENQELLNNK